MEFEEEIPPNTILWKNILLLLNIELCIDQSRRYSNENLRNMEICGQLVMNTLPSWSIGIQGSVKGTSH